MYIRVYIRKAVNPFETLAGFSPNLKALATFIAKFYALKCIQIVKRYNPLAAQFLQGIINWDDVLLIVLGSVVVGVQRAATIWTTFCVGVFCVCECEFTYVCTCVRVCVCIKGSFATLIVQLNYFRWSLRGFPSLAPQLKLDKLSAWRIQICALKTLKCCRCHVWLRLLHLWHTHTHTCVAHIPTPISPSPTLSSSWPSFDRVQNETMSNFKKRSRNFCRIPKVCNGKIKINSNFKLTLSNVRIFCDKS